MGMKELQVQVAVGVLRSMYNEHRTVLHATPDEFLDEGEFAQAVVVDPGISNGVAAMTPDAVLLATLTPMELTYYLTRKWAPLTLAVERPLHGAVRVYDPMPWQVYGLLRLWYEAWVYHTEFIDADVSWLKAGHKMATLKGGQPSQHAKDAFAHLNYLISQERIR